MNSPTLSTRELPAGADSPRPTFHWGLIVAGLYAALFCLLTVPLLMTCFASEFTGENPAKPFGVYGEYGYWIFIGVVALSQFLFLSVPVRLEFKKTTTRRSLWLPVFVSGFWLGCLVWGGSLSLAEGFKIQGESAPTLALALALVSWAIWGLVFWRMGAARDASELIARQRSWLLRGSILELLIAVPAHIVARGRADCCAGFLTFCGITMGVSVMLLSFGPAVLLLYRARSRRLLAKAQAKGATS